MDMVSEAIAIARSQHPRGAASVLADEVERLRGLLREAQHMIAGNLCHYVNDAPANLVARIDAVIDTNVAANRVVSGIADKTPRDCLERGTRETLDGGRDDPDLR